MAGPQQEARHLSRRYSWMALALAGVAGAVDGIGYLLLAHIFTSHMSGNTVAMMLHVATGNWHEAWRHIEPIVVFFGAIVAGMACVDALVALRVSRMFAVLAGIEFLLLLAFFVLAAPARAWMVVFPASAMGVQNAMLRRAGHHRVRTTFITGMLTNAAQGLVEGIRALLTRSDEAREKLSDWAFYSAIWLFFAAGGILAALIFVAHGRDALLLPLSALAVFIGMDAVSPVTETPVEQASGE